MGCSQVDGSFSNNYLVGLTIINDNEMIISTPDIVHLYESAWKDGFQVKGNTSDGEDTNMIGQSISSLYSVHVPCQDNITKLFSNNFDDIFLASRNIELTSNEYDVKAIQDSSIVYENNINPKRIVNSRIWTGVIDDRSIYLLLRENALAA